MKIKNKNTQISLSLSSFLFPNLNLSQLSFSLSKSFSEIFSLFLLKINNTAILFLVLFSSKKKFNEKCDYFATLFGSRENQREKLRKSKGKSIEKTSSPLCSVWKLRKRKEKGKAP